MLCKVAQAVTQCKLKCSTAPVCKQFYSKSSWLRPSVIRTDVKANSAEDLKQTLKLWWKVAELNTEVENIVASNEEICQEILEGQFDGVNFPSFNSHGKILPY